jgi:hypothetical protein
MGAPAVPDGAPHVAVDQQVDDQPRLLGDDVRDHSALQGREHLLGAVGRVAEVVAPVVRCELATGEVGEGLLVSDVQPVGVGAAEEQDGLVGRARVGDAQAVRVDRVDAVEDLVAAHPRGGDHDPGSRGRPQHRMHHLVLGPAGSRVVARLGRSRRSGKRHLEDRPQAGQRGNHSPGPPGPAPLAQPDQPDCPKERSSGAPGEGGRKAHEGQPSDGQRQDSQEQASHGYLEIANATRSGERKAAESSPQEKGRSPATRAGLLPYLCARGARATVHRGARGEGGAPAQLVEPIE